MTERNSSPQPRRTGSDGRFSMRRWAAVFASCLVPGAGHWILGRHAKGLLLMSAAALDVAAIIKLADTAGGRHLLLIVYLGMALPALYFYGVFDTLQTTGSARAEEEPLAEGETAVDDSTTSVDQEGVATVVDRSRYTSGDEAFRWLHAVPIIVAGLLLLFLLRMPDKLRPWLDSAGDYGAPVLLLALTAWIALRRREDGRYRLGRWTAAVLSLGTGVLLLSDEWTGNEHIALLGSWWPLLFVLIGGELLAYSLRRRSVPRRLSTDMSAVTAAVVVAVTAYSITQYAELPFRWLDQWAAQRSGYSNFSEEKGFSYDKETVSADVPADLKRIVIDNPNGNVYVQRGTSNQIVIKSTVWIDSSDRAQADSAAAGTAVELTAQEETSIKTVLQGFGEGGERKPRVNVTIFLPPSVVDAVPIDKANPGNGQQDSTDNPVTENAPIEQQGIANATDLTDAAGTTDTISSTDTAGAGSQNQTPIVPLTSQQDQTLAPDGQLTDDVPEQPEKKAEAKEEQLPLELRIQIQSGDAEVFDLAAPSAVTIDIGNGRIVAQRIAGTVSAKAVNGSVQVMQVSGEVAASVSNGAINVVEAGGNVTASTANGGIHLNQVLGDIEVETKNGEVSVREAAGRVKADTLNGTIEVYSGTVGGDWDIVGLVGDVRLQLPPDGSYELNGSVTFGQIRIDPGLPLTSVRKTVRGTIGGGEHRIYVNANSSIVIAPFAQ
ncbi:DUF4097 family beta strand repeat-containing protein [Paenibacillus kobensis]|uniref:DUF4097 family beta strand repeat-containing protein n=1 Tax=Paenibacillus kobensis TaxID=59841 RepID=UPI000FD86C29|nr:DUF6677 family protein [Paenibacillus kobensis]